VTSHSFESDGTRLITRRGDIEDLIYDRLRIYQQQTLPVAEYYRCKGDLSEIDGNCPVESIMAETLAIIRNRCRL
jgi:adenylate kinase family enzyme